MADDSVGSDSRIGVLNRFRSEYADEIEETYEQRYSDGLDIDFTGPAVITNRGPAVATQESNTLNYEAEMDMYDDILPFRVTVHDMSYKVDEVFNQGMPDVSKFADAFKTNFNPEAPRTRFVQLSLDDTERDGEELKDQWFALKQAVNEVLEPEEDFAPNEFEHVYVYEHKLDSSS